MRQITASRTEHVSWLCSEWDSAISVPRRFPDVTHSIVADKNRSRHGTARYYSHVI